MKHIFIMNPLAGAGKVTKQKLEEILSALNIDWEIYPSKSPADISNYIVKRSNNEPDETFRFYACGGDGTIKNVADGVIKTKNAEMSVYPVGSGNDFVKYYGGKDAFFDLKNLCKQPAHYIDIIKVGNEYSLNVTNFGFESCVAETMIKVKRKKIIGGKNAYTTGIVKAVFTSMRNKADIYADGKKLNNGLFLLCNIANGSHVGGSYNCAPHAVTNDGLLEVCVVKPISIFKFLTLINYYKNGTHLDCPKFKKILTYTRAKKIEVFSEKENSITLDGEIVKLKDFTVEVIHNAIKFASPMVPEKNMIFTTEEVK